MTKSENSQGILTSHCAKMPIGSEMVSFTGGSMNLVTLCIKVLKTPTKA